MEKLTGNMLQPGFLVIKNSVFRNVRNIVLGATNSMLISGSTFENLQDCYIITRGLPGNMTVVNSVFKYTGVYNVLNALGMPGLILVM